MPKLTRIIRLGLSGLMGCVLLGCAGQRPAPPNTAGPGTSSSTTGTTLVQVGEVINVRDLTIGGGQTSGIGAFLGSVVGAIAGSQIGGGAGRSAATIGGTVAGGVAGQRTESASNSSKRTEVTVRLADGAVHSYTVDPGESFRIGDQVKVVTSHGETRVTH